MKKSDLFEILKPVLMRFLHGKVKARKGQTIKVNFSDETRVLIMNEKNFNKYKNNLTFTYFGGQKDSSPYEFAAPKDGLWFVVVEKGTYHEPRDITASIELEPLPVVEKALPQEEEEEDDDHVDAEEEDVETDD